MSTNLKKNDRCRQLNPKPTGLGAFVVVVICFIQVIPRLASAGDILDRAIDVDVSVNTPLEVALINWGTAVGVTIMINTGTVGHRLAPPVHGRLSAREALSLLLHDSGLTYSENNDTIKIIAADRVVRSGPRSNINPQEDANSLTPDTRGTDVTYLSRKSNEGTSRDLTEVIVTANKRSEQLFDVPTAVSAISGEDLQALHVESLSDLAYYVPGLEAPGQGVPGSRTIIIRGLYSGDNTTNAALVGTYINDLPIGPSTGQAFGTIFGLDLNPFDVDHIEVLKGPQGTLYGANTMGGLIKYVLKEPNLNHFDGTSGGNLEHIDGSGSVGWQIHGAASVPIVTDSLALRVSAFDRRNAGYIDNLYSGETDFNSTRQAGGLATLLWRVNDQLDLKAIVAAQDVNAASQAIVAYDPITRKPTYGGLFINAPFLNPEKNSVRMYSLSVDWKLDFATLTSTSGWSHFSAYGLNGAPGLGALCAGGALGTGYAGCPDYPLSTALSTFIFWSQYQKFVQEVRLASPENRRLEWMIGGFFTHEIPEIAEELPTYTAQTEPLPPADSLFNTLIRGSYKEAAGFANLTFKVTNKLELSAGGRYSAYSITDCTLELSGILSGGASPAPCQNTPSTSVVLWMANASFHFTRNTMLYARAATGYRPGFGCPDCGIDKLGIPGVVKPDRTTDYEVGVKGSFFDKRLTLDTSGYHIPWRDMQITSLTPTQVSYSSNAGSAVSNGWELTADYLVARGVSVAATVAFNHAYLNESAPGIGGRDGDILPYSTRWASSFRVDYEKALDSEISVLVGADYRYKDGFVDAFPGQAPNYDRFAPVSIFDLYAGVVIDNVTVRIYSNNVSNRLGFQQPSGGGTTITPFLVPVVPRTVGLSVDYSL